MSKRRHRIPFRLYAILLAGLVLIGLVFYLRNVQMDRKALTIDETPILATRIRALGELTTACFYGETVISESKPNAFSTTALGSLARDGLGRDVDDHLVIVANGTVRAGIDLREMTGEDILFSGDTVVVRLPFPRYLDVIINPSDFEVFAESGKWTQDEVSRLQETARRKIVSEADGVGLKETAYERATEAVTDLLAACGYTCIRFVHPVSSLNLPAPEGFRPLRP